MSVSIDTARGGKKPLLVDLNVVPFIDFLSCLIAFLMLGAVWTQLSALDLEQGVSPPNPTDDPTPPVPPLTLHVQRGAVWIGRTAETGRIAAAVDGSPDWRAVRALIEADHAAFPDQRLAVINTDDGVPYEQMIQALDLTREVGYPDTVLAGGAPSAL